MQNTAPIPPIDPTIIDAEWVEIEPHSTIPTASDPEPPIVNLVTRPYSEESPVDSVPNEAFWGSTLLRMGDRLITPWGIAGLSLLLTGNILLTWAQWSSRPTETAQNLSNAPLSPSSFANIVPEQSRVNISPTKPLDINHLSAVKSNIPPYKSIAAKFSQSPPSMTQIAPTASLATSLLPSGLGKQTSAIAPAYPIANSSATTSVPKTRRSYSAPPVTQVLPIPASLQPIPLPPPPPLAQTPAPVNPTATAPTNEQRLQQILRSQNQLEQGNAPQPFNLKTRQMLQNSINNSPAQTSTTEEGNNSAPLDQLKQQSQANQGN